MNLVGVITKDKEILNALRNEFNDEKINFIDLNLKVIENFKNIKFDIILISNLEENNKNDKFKRVISNSSVVVINADIKNNLKILENVKGIIIAYGFNSKATITASSINDNNISICVQRVIENIYKEKIEPIEYIESLENIKTIEISDVIGIKTIKILLTKKKN